MTKLEAEKDYLYYESFLKRLKTCAYVYIHIAYTCIHLHILYKTYTYVKYYVLYFISKLKRKHKLT